MNAKSMLRFVVPKVLNLYFKLEFLHVLSRQRDLRVLQEIQVFNENPLKLFTLEKYLELVFYSLCRT